MRHFILLLIFFNYFPVFNQVKNDSIQIRGVGSYYKNEEIGLYVIEDYITGKEKCILQSSVDSVGFFKFNIRVMTHYRMRCGLNHKATFGKELKHLVFICSTRVLLFVVLEFEKTFTTKDEIRFSQ